MESVRAPTWNREDVHHGGQSERFKGTQKCVAPEEEVEIGSIEFGKERRYEFASQFL
jgi:hypothetical protein